MFILGLLDHVLWEQVINLGAQDSCFVRTRRYPVCTIMYAQDSFFFLQLVIILWI